jgi:guanine nucleotide-binding protein subunit alpha
MNYQLPGDSRTPLDHTVKEAIENIWMDSVTQMCIQEKANEFYLMDSAP